MFTKVDTEKKVLACCLHSIGLVALLPRELFTDPDVLAFFDSLTTFHKKYNVTPTPDTFMSRNEFGPVVLTMFTEIDQLKSKVTAPEFPVYVDDLYNLLCSRVLYEEFDDKIKKLDTSEGSKLASAVLTRLIALKNPLRVGKIERGFAYERARQRWDEYLSWERDPSIRSGTSTGITDMDAVLHGGLHPGWSVAFRGEKGSGKSRMLFNIGYNVARYQKKFVMYVTREMPRHWLELCIDSRDSGLEFTQIVEGKLGPTKSVYGRALSEQVNRLDPFYIVDMPFTGTTSDLVAELEQCYSKFGRYPDGMIIDYGGLMNPDRKYEGEHNRGRFVSEELHELSHMYNIWALTAYQSSKEGETAFSYHIKDNVEVLMEIATDPVLRQANRLRINVEYCRYGKAAEAFELFAPFAINYVGNFDVEITLQGKPVGPQLAGNVSILQRASGGGTPSS